MSKKGFSLVELLVVIAIMAVIVLIAYPVTTTVMKSINSRSFTGKQELILAAANEYANDRLSVFALQYETIIKVKDLLDNDYIEPDSTDKKKCGEDNKCIINPETNEVINNSDITVRYVNNTVTAYWGSSNKTRSQDLLAVTCDELLRQHTTVGSISCDCTSLVNNNDTCYFKGIDVNNYVYYSGIYWRILGVYRENNTNKVKMITDKNISLSE